MLVKNTSTGREYPISKKDWESLGKNKNVFEILDSSDDNIVKEQPITNVANKPGKKIEPVIVKNAVEKRQRPSTGEKK